jgi:hypothetical protein
MELEGVMASEEGGPIKNVALGGACGGRVMIGDGDGRGEAGRLTDS